MPTSLTSTYLLPAILLNPILVLQSLNTLITHWAPASFPLVEAAATSPHPKIAYLGPPPGVAPFLDVHASEHLCWSYTLLMVIVQLLAFGQVHNTRDRRKVAKAKKVERDRVVRERMVAERVRSHEPRDSGIGGLDAFFREELQNGDIANGKATCEDRTLESDVTSDATSDVTSEEETIV